MNSKIILETKNSVYYQFHIFNKIYFFYSNLLKPLLDIKLYDKIGVNNSNIYNPQISLINHNKFNFELYLDKYSKFQSIKRYIHKQSRNITFSSLTIIFNEYYNVLIEINKINNLQIKNKFINLNNQLINNLEILRDTYNNDNYVNINIASYITILLTI